MPDKERCPVCGDAMNENKCPFCGYVLTQYDMDARQKWESQKQSMGESPDVDTGAFDAAKTIAAAVSKAGGDIARKRRERREQARSESDRQLERPENRAPKAASDRPCAPDKKVPEAKSRGKPKKTGSARRPNVFHRILFGILVAAWFFTYLFLVGQKLYDDWYEGLWYEDWGGSVPEGSDD